MDSEQIKISVKTYVEDTNISSIVSPILFDQNVDFICQHGCVGMVLKSDRHIHAPNKIIYFTQDDLKKIFEFLIERE